MTDRHKVIFVFRRGRRYREQLLEQGLGPDEMLYGVNYLDKDRFEVAIVEGDDRRWNLIRALTFPLELAVSKVTKMGIALHISLENLRILRTADVIVSTVDACGLPIAALKWLRVIKCPVLYISQGLSDRIGRMRPNSVVYRIVFPLYRKLLLSVDRIIVLGEGAVQHFIDVFRVPPERIQKIPFGIDVKFWTPGERPPAGYILSVGSDQARDYDTLLKAVAQHNLKIVTRLPISRELLTPQTEVGTDYTDVELRELYRQADFVVTPLQDFAQPSGQSATLQAMACGKAVILTATQGLWEPQALRHMDTCYLVKPGDVADLQRAIAFFAAHPEETQRIGENARALVVQQFSSAHLGNSMERSVEAMLESDVHRVAHIQRGV